MKRFSHEVVRRLTPVKRLSCVEFADLVTAYLDDAVDSADKAAFDDHKARCADCARHLRQLRATISALAEFPPDQELSASTRARLLAAFRESHPPTETR
jgi:anti-sigma factor RsiW